MTEKRVALLIDGENLAAQHAAFALRNAETLGSVTIRRVYGNLTKVGKWTVMPGFRPVHVPSGKNVGDLALSLDALEMALTGQVQAFCIATSDRDLALVALRLRELGFQVTGIGEASKTAPDFRAACSAFFSVPETVTVKPKIGEPKPPPPFEERLKTFLRAEGDADGWVQLNALGQQKAKAQGISKTDAGIGKSSSWLDWFGKRATVFELEKRGTESRARLKSR